MSLADVERVHGKWMNLDHDPDLLHIVLATVIANRMSKMKPLWIALSGPSGSGKTAITKGIGGASECMTMSSFTPAAFASAITGAALLEEMDGRVVIVTDFSTIASMPRETVTQLLSILRDCYDGSYERRTGKSSMPIRWEGRFGLIACSTMEATDKHIIGADLGERFLVVRMKVTERSVETMTDAAFDVEDVDEASKELASVTGAFLDGLSTPDNVRVPVSLKKTMVGIAKAVAFGRTHVSRDRLTREVDAPITDSIEVPTRVVQQLKTLATGLIAMGEGDESDLRRILVRVGRDSMTSKRLRALDLIATGESSVSKLAKGSRTSVSDMMRTVEELCLLGIIEDSKIRKGAYDIAIQEVREVFEVTP